MMRQLSCILLIFLSLACLASAPVQAAPVAFDWLEAPAEVLEARVAKREREGRDPSDAGVEVLRKQLSYDLGEMIWGRVDASGTPGEVLEGAMGRLEPAMK